MSPQVAFLAKLVLLQPTCNKIGVTCIAWCLNDSSVPEQVGQSGITNINLRMMDQSRSIFPDL